MGPTDQLPMSLLFQGSFSDEAPPPLTGSNDHPPDDDSNDHPSTSIKRRHDGTEIPQGWINSPIYHPACAYIFEPETPTVEFSDQESIHHAFGCATSAASIDQATISHLAQLLRMGQQRIRKSTKLISNQHSTAQESLEKINATIKKILQAKAAKEQEAIERAKDQPPPMMYI